MTVLWQEDTEGARVSKKTVILFILTLGSAGTNLAILPYLPLPLWANEADIPFDMLYTRLSQRQRGVVVIALTFPSYYMLSGRNLIPQRHFSFCLSLSLAVFLTSALVSVFSSLSLLPPATPFERLLPDNTSMSNPVRRL